MESRAKMHGEEWPYLDLSHHLKNAKSSKKVPQVDKLRNRATLEAVRLAALLQGSNARAGFSIIDLIHSIPSLIQVDSYQLEGTRRQLQHHNKAPAWRHTSPALQAMFYQLAMHDTDLKGGGNLIHSSFTLDLTPEFVHRAFQNKTGFIDYTKRKIDKAMKSELGRNPQYWFTVEMVTVFGSTTKGRVRPHLHGSILLTPPEIKSIHHQKTPISRAMHKAVGKCSPSFSNRLLKIRTHDDFAKMHSTSAVSAIIGWSDYCFDAKDRHNKTPAIYRLLLNSKNLTADNATKEQAEALYGRLTPKAPKLSPEDEKALEAFMSWN
jgi:hypothetical protein